jgi:signal transduction histidine kinase
MKLFSLRNWSLRAKLAALLIAASVMPLTISAFIDIREMRLQRITDARNLLAARADQVAREIDSIHQGYWNSTERVSRLPAVQAYCAAPPDQRADHATRLLGVFGTFNKSDPQIHGVAVIDTRGQIVLSSDPQRQGADMSSRPAVRQALAGKAVITGIAHAPRQGELQPTVAYLAPVRDAHNQVSCVVAIAIQAEVFWDILKTAHEGAGANSYAVLYDEWGVRIGLSMAHPMLFRPSGPVDPAVLELQVAQKRFGPRTREFLEDTQAFFPAHFERARAASPDANVFFAWAPVNQSWNYGVARRVARLPWTVVYMVPEANILAEIAQATRDKLLLALGIMAMAAALGLMVAASILRPVRALSAATAQLAAGETGARVPDVANDELGQLGASFNAMAGRLEAQAAELQHTNDELRQRAEDLEIANKDLDAFAFSVSHDLRAPLHVVDGFSKILETKFAGQLDDKAAHYLRRIRAGVVVMEQLVQGILKLSRLGRQPLDKQTVNVADVVNEVLVQLRTAEVLMDDRVQVTGALLQVQGDRVLLQQVFANLLSNACKFTANQPAPETRVGCELRDGEQVYFVRDNGAGFDPVYANKLFEPFQRLHSTEEFSGLGIGLSIVKRIVERHGGRIWAEAEVDRGACFYFTLAGPSPADPDQSAA